MVETKPLLIQGMGYIPDIPDINDYSIETDVVRDDMMKLKVEDTTTLPETFDFTPLLARVRNQGSIGSCTAFSYATLREYFTKTLNNGKEYPISTLMHYKKTRDLMGVTGDTGAYMRTSMKAGAIYGSVHEREYPYDTSKYDLPIKQQVLDTAQLNQATKYLRVDQPNISSTELVKQIKQWLVKKVPLMKGFGVYESYTQANSNGGRFPYPKTGERQVGGHAVALCGYDNARRITNSLDGSTTTGAFRLRNSWGSSWGESGNGWIPYKYFETQLAVDVWALLDSEFVDLMQFN
jgi:C1A family cysteine protease